MSANHVKAGRASRPLSEADVVEIREAVDGGSPLTRQAAWWGVHLHTIRNIVYGRTYRDYGGPIREPRS